MSKRQQRLALEQLVDIFDLVLTGCFIGGTVAGTVISSAAGASKGWCAAIGIASGVAVPVILVGALHTADAIATRRRSHPKKIPENLAKLRSRNSSEARSGAFCLAKTGREAIPHLLIALQDEDAWVRRYAADALGSLKPSLAEDVIPALIVALDDEDKGVREEAVIAVTHFGAKSGEAVPRLALLVESRDASAGRAAGALGRIGSAAAIAVPVLVDAVRNGGKVTSLTGGAVFALGEIGPAAKEAVGVLVDALKHDDLYVRMHAARALAQIGVASPQVLAALGEAKKVERVWQVKTAMRDALWKLRSRA